MQSVFHHFFSHNNFASRANSRSDSLASSAQIWPADDFTCRHFVAQLTVTTSSPHPLCTFTTSPSLFYFPRWQELNETCFTPLTLNYSHLKDLKVLGTLLPPGAPPDWAAGWAPCVPLLLQSTLARTVRTSLQSRRSVRNAALLDLFPPSSTWPPVAILDPACEPAAKFDRNFCISHLITSPRRKTASTLHLPGNAGICLFQPNMGRLWVLWSGATRCGPQ